MESNVALVIIFNHRYDQNIPILESIYKDRFSNIYFLVPFYTGKKDNVIPVYENSIYFQGYLAQGFTKYFKEQFEHYFFFADDMVLNPEINEKNYQEFFGIDKESAFIPEIFTLDNFTKSDTLLFYDYEGLRHRILSRLLNRSVKPEKYQWSIVPTVFSYNPKVEGVESSNEIPSFEQATLLIKRHGFDIRPLQYIDVFGSCPFPTSMSTFRTFVSYIFHQKLRKTRYPLQYPIVAAYSDIVIVPARSIATFAHYCGVFAATELYVECAIPTALLLAVDKVVFQSAISKKGHIYWTYLESEKQHYDQEMSRYDFNLNNLLNHFPANVLYIHPVKLSKWKTQEEL